MDAHGFFIMYLFAMNNMVKIYKAIVKKKCYG